MSRSLDKRYGRLKEWFYKPYQKMIHEFPTVSAAHPFQIVVKETNFSYSLDKVFQHDIPALHHGNDGLIYTCVSTPYTPGTDRNILKWKPPSENSVDFRLLLRFPSSPTNPAQPDYHAKPIFSLHVWTGGTNYDPFDVMQVEDEEWEKIKASGEQYDDRIVEVHWDPSAECWRMMRFRDDKPNGNHRTVVENLIQSIRDGVEKEALLDRSTAIRNAWKARHGMQPTNTSVQNATAVQGGPPPQQPQPPPPPPPLVLQPQPKPLAVTAPPLLSSEDAQIRYGPIELSKWSKVSGPAMWAGMYR